MPSGQQTDEKLAASIFPRVRQRLDVLRIRIARVDEAAADFGPLLFLKHEFDKGSLRGLKVVRDTKATQAMQYKFDQSQRNLLLSDRLLSTICLLARQRNLGRRQVDWLVDNFLIHEFLHMSQGMSGNRHSDLRTQSPKVLLAIDYQADAAAIIISMLLAGSEPEAFGFTSDEVKNNRWLLSQEGVQSVIHQIELFTWLSRMDRDRQKISELPVPLERFQRIALWHFQYHRMTAFNPAVNPADFQFLFQPILDFRNLTLIAILHPRGLDANWPKDEAQIMSEIRNWASKVGFHVPPDEVFQLILTGPTPNGTTAFARHVASSDRHWVDVFRGIFECDLAKSGPFFGSVLANNPWLTGHESPKLISGRRSGRLDVDSNGLSVKATAGALDRKYHSVTVARSTD